MAFDEGLAERVRAVLDERSDVADRRMFGGIAFLVADNMACGVMRDAYGMMLSAVLAKSRTAWAGAAAAKKAIVASTAQ